MHACQSVCDDVKKILSMYQRILEPDSYEQSPIKSEEIKTSEEVQDLRIWEVISRKKYEFKHLNQHAGLSNDL